MSLPKYGFNLNDVIEEKKVTKEEISEVQEWMPTANLPSVSDEMIATFIVACQRDVAMTKKVIRSYFHMKKNYPEIFDDWDIDNDELSFASNVIQHISIPAYTEDGNAVHVFRLTDTKFYNFHINPIAKLCFMLVDITLNKSTIPKGLIVIIDAKGAGLMHLTRFKLRTMKLLIDYLQEGMPLNLKEIHVINTILMVDKLVFMLKPFMKPELFNKLHLHPNNTDMEEFSMNHVPKKCLPSDYGGVLPSCDELNQKTIERYRELRDFFDTEEMLRKEWEEALSEY